MAAGSSSARTAGAPCYATEAGVMYVGLAEEVLARPGVQKAKGKVSLIFTSPPFPLNRKKEYGNLQGDEYTRWLANLAGLFSGYLVADGSIVIELGNGWEPGSPTMSTVSMKALLAFQESAGLHLCQEFICFNPARLPTPAQWVTIERSRVKDSFTRVWWMSPTPRPKADNRKVLTEYSDSMRRLLRRGTYNSGRRPSQHTINDRTFLTNNGGAIPPNVLIPPESDVIWLSEVLPIPNTSSHDAYHRHCRETGLPAHPARMPEKLAEFFIEFLTDPGDLVLDPFAGSNTTGVVAERLGRRWMAIEANGAYARASEGRFARTQQRKKRRAA